MQVATLSQQAKETSDELKNVRDVRAALETQMENHREQHHKQLTALRDEISEKHSMIEQLKEWVVSPGYDDLYVLYVI